MAKELLAKYLEYAYNEDAEAKKSLDRVIRQKELESGKVLTAWHDDKIMKVRELIQTEAIESTTLVQTEFYDTVIKGAEYVKCVREAIPSFKGKGPTYRFVKGESNAATTAYANEVAEGAEIQMRTQDYGYTDATFKTVAEVPRVTKTLIEDQKFDVVAMEVENTGIRVENKLNYDVVDNMLENSGLEHDTAGTAHGVKALASARGLVSAQGFMPDRVIMHPDLETKVLLDFIPSNYFGGQGIFATGNIGAALGLSLYRWGGTTSSTTYTWSYAADTNIGGLVFDSRKAEGLAFARPITVEKYNDPIKDLRSCLVSTRYAYSYLQANAIARIEF